MGIEVRGASVRGGVVIHGGRLPRHTMHTLHVVLHGDHKATEDAHRHHEELFTEAR